ncbi:MAG: dihydroneopterin aldolase [Alphaproteobacteria bacterium]|nr:dihydroneopterin aldolase [Alphaproteobacteria bacterium]
MSTQSTISIFVKETRVNLRIGLCAHEKEAPQPVDVSVELFTDISYLYEADPENIIDYAKIHAAVKGWEARDHVELIEEYLKELLELGFSFPRVSAVRASISKPAIFEDAAGAGLEVYMNRQDWSA